MQGEQHLFRWRVQRLADVLDTIELRKTSWQEALARLAPWKTSEKLSAPCDVHVCSVDIELTELVFAHFAQRNLFIKIDDYIRWRFKRSYGIGPLQRAEQTFLPHYMRWGGRPARYSAQVGMRDGIVWSKGVSIDIEESARNPGEWDTGNQFLDFSFLASAETVPRLEHRWHGWVSPQLARHPQYLIGRPGGCTICVSTWTKFTPYTDPKDVQRLMQMNLACLTRWQPCISHEEILPAAWAEFQRDQATSRASTSEIPCSPAMIRMLGREATEIGVAEVLEDGPDRSRLRLVERLRGMADWRVGQTKDARFSASDKIRRANTPVGSRIVVFGERGLSHELAISEVNVCPNLPANGTNLELIRQGIAQDYSGPEN